MDIQFIPNRAKNSDYKEAVLSLRKRAWGIENLIFNSNIKIQNIKKFVIELDCINDKCVNIYERIAFFETNLYDLTDNNDVLDKLISLLKLISEVGEDKRLEFEIMFNELKNISFPVKRISKQKKTKNVKVSIIENIFQDKSVFNISIVENGNILIEEAILDTNNPFEIHNSLYKIEINDNVVIKKRDNSEFKIFHLTTSSSR